MGVEGGILQAEDLFNWHGIVGASFLISMSSGKWLYSTCNGLKGVTVS